MLAAVLVSAGVPAGATVLVSGPASVLTATCQGSRIATLTHKRSGGVVVATTGVYETADHRICAVTIKQGALYGQSTRMDLRMTRFRKDNSSTHESDVGKFKYQAGAITMSALNSCIYIDLAMWGPGGAEIVQDHTYTGWCR
ncbi:hypothetical protein OV208_11350 [Corallococcus sp. bb12-1]|uniref:hypothetical protein n=1 Tax=Corallococcus sp. bb12-1 TaxID=2996784 RepID=UPI0022710091|nr:hypothetical protein [Corallococcus sp. bb12-1]MCY1041910.1 hypothetical protein [Corallococcus sp. bb12-1]